MENSSNIEQILNLPKKKKRLTVRDNIFAVNHDSEKSIENQLALSNELEEEYGL